MEKYLKIVSVFFLVLTTAPCSTFASMQKHIPVSFVPEKNRKQTFQPRKRKIRPLPTKRLKKMTFRIQTRKEILGQKVVNEAFDWMEENFLQQIECDPNNSQKYKSSCRNVFNVMRKDPLCLKVRENKDGKYFQKNPNVIAYANPTGIVFREIETKKDHQGNDQLTIPYIVTSVHETGHKFLMHCSTAKSLFPKDEGEFQANTLTALALDGTKRTKELSSFFYTNIYLFVKDPKWSPYTISAINAFVKTYKQKNIFDQKLEIARQLLYKKSKHPKATVDDRMSFIKNWKPVYYAWEAKQQTDQLLKKQGDTNS